MQTQTINMTYKKQTKGTWVYGDKDGLTAIPALYIRKNSVDWDEPPQKIIVTLEAK